MPFNCVKDLAESWIKAVDDDEGSQLMVVERDSIRRVLGLPKAGIYEDLNQCMTKDLRYFLEVGTQIKSLEMFWKQIIRLKKRRDALHAKGQRFRLPAGLNQQRYYLIGLQVIPRRSNIGLSSIASDARVTQRIKESEHNRYEWEHSGSETTDDEPERGRTIKRSTRPGKGSRYASQESAARRKRQRVKDKESESAATEDLTISEESAIPKTEKRSGRKDAKDKRTQLEKEVMEIMEEEMMLKPSDPEYWEGRVPNMFNKKYSHLNYWPVRKSAQTSTTAKESGTSDNESTAGKESKSAAAEDSASSSEELNSSRKRQQQQTQTSSSAGRPRNASKRLIQKEKSTKDSQAAKESATSDNDSTAGKNLKTAAEDSTASEEYTTAESASSSDGSAVSKGKHRGRKNAKDSTAPKESAAPKKAPKESLKDGKYYVRKNAKASAKTNVGNIPWEKKLKKRMKELAL